MALLIRLTRTAEDETTVTHRYGPTWEDQPRSVTVLEQTGEASATADRDDRQVAGWLTRRRRTAGSWTSRGQIVA